MRIAIRWIPLALTLALAIEALLAIAMLAPLEIRRSEDTFGFVVVAARLVAGALAPVGLFQLSRRTTTSVRAGATIAAIGCVAALVMQFVSTIMRRGDFVQWASFAAAAAIAIGYAWMIARRSAYVAIAVLVVVIAGPWALDHQPVQLHVIRALAVVAVELVIAALVSPVLAPSRADPARNLAIAAAAIYAASLFLPAIRIMGFQLDDPQPETMLGVVCLLYGWIVWIGWLANPLLLVGAILLAVNRPRAALAFGFLAVCSAAAAPFLLYEPRLGMRTIQIGYWVWVASIVTFNLAAYARLSSRSPLRG